MFCFIFDFFLAVLNKIFVIFIQILTPIVYLGRTNFADAVTKLKKFSNCCCVGSSQRGSHNNSAYKAQILWKDLCFANSRLSF